LPTASNSVRRARPLLGTFVEIAVAGATRPRMNAAVEAAFGVLSEVHRLMSFQAADSDVSRLNAQAWLRPVRVHAWTFQVLRAAVALHRRSAGVFDITVAPILQEMGLLARPREQRQAAARDRATTAAIELLPGHRARFKQPDMRIDLGGIAKGFAVDRAIDVLREHGMPTGLVNAGGDLAVFGPNLNAVHIRDPRDPGRLLCRLGLRNEALASSGRQFDPFVSAQAIAAPVIIDPIARKPAHAALGASVRAPCCMLADALTKVVMLTGPPAAHLLDHYRAGALLVLADGAVHMTPDVASAVCLAT
jgi:FAD:protein FMN transferase